MGSSKDTRCSVVPLSTTRAFHGNCSSITGLVETTLAKAIHPVGQYINVLAMHVR